MRHLLTAALCALALAAAAGPIVESFPANMAAQATTTAIRSMPDFIDLTNQLAQYTADKIVYTGQVAQVSDAQTRQAIKALADMVQDLKQAVADQKRLIKALANSTTNSAVVDN